MCTTDSIYYYIKWAEDCKVKRISKSPEATKTYNPPHDKDMLEALVLGDHLSGDEDKCHYTKMKRKPDQAAFYVVRYHESGGGQSYHDIDNLFVYDDFDTVISCLEDIYMQEHQYDTDCTL